MQECAMFRFPIYKDQGTPANLGKIIEVADVVTVALSNDGTPSVEAQALTVTQVLDEGRTICWNREATGEDFRSTDIYRVHAKHQYNPVLETASYEIEVVKDEDSLAEITSIVLGGASYAFECIEEGSVSDNFTQDFVDCVEDRLNAILVNNGTAVVTFSTDTMTITLLATQMVPGAITGDNITPDVGGWVAPA